MILHEACADFHVHFTLLYFATFLLWPAMDVIRWQVSECLVYILLLRMVGCSFFHRHEILAPFFSLSEVSF